MEHKNKKAVIFGITGQDGSYLAELLLEKNYEVFGVHRRTASPNFDRLRNVVDNPNFELICGDVTDSGSVTRIFNDIKPDEIYNLAAQSHVGISFKEPSHSIDVTMNGVVVILEAALNMYRDGLTPRIYQASSSEMFGDGVSQFQAWKNTCDCAKGIGITRHDAYFGELNPEEGELFQDESTHMRPQSPYAIAKLGAHHMCGLYRRSYGMHISCGILFNHSSPRRGENFVEKKITNWIRMFRERVSHYKFGFSLISNDGKNILIQSPFEDDNMEIPMLRLGNLEAKRDIGHAKDYVRGMYEMLQQETPDDYVLCTGETHSIKEILEEAFSYVIVDWEHCVVQDPKFMRPSEVPHLNGKCNKANNKLNWQPTITFKEMIKEMVYAEE